MSTGTANALLYCLAAIAVGIPVVVSTLMMRATIATLAASMNALAAVIARLEK